MSHRYPHEAVAAMEVSGRWRRTKELQAQGLELDIGRPWMSLEVLGSLWMAPRAGFEVSRKLWN